MLLRFRCKDCGQKYQVSDDYVAAEFQCVACGGDMEIPEDSTLNDRPAIDLGDNDHRPLVNIQVNIKSASPNNVLGSDKEFAANALTEHPEAENLVAAETLVDEEPVQLTAKPAGITLSAKPAPLSSAPAEKSAKLSLGGSSAVQIKPPTPSKPKITSPTMPAANQSSRFTPKNIAPGDGFCEQHPHLRATSTCNTCHKPICLECRQEWGYYCSEACRDVSLSTLDRQLKTKRNQAYAKMDWVIRGIKIVMLTLTCVVVGYSGLWVWRQFLDPGGKVAWRWNKPVSLSHFNFLSMKPKRITFLSAESIVTLDSQTGKTISSFSNKGLERCPILQKKLPDKIIVSGEHGVAAVDFKGELLWETTYKNSVIAVSAGSKAALVTTRRWEASKEIIQTRQGRMSKPPIAITYRGALDLTQGKKLWRVKQAKKNYVNVAAVGYKNFISTTTTYTANGRVTILKVNDFQTGKTLWHTRLPSRLTMGPLIYQGNIIFKFGNSLNAVSMSGKKLWKAEVEGYCSSHDFADSNGLACFRNENILTVFDMNKGKILWSKPLEGGQVSYVDGKLLMVISEADKDYGKHEIKVKLPPAYEKLKKGDPTMTALLGGGKTVKRVKYDRFIICLDALTGKRLWKSAKVIGQLIVGYGRATIFRDSATTTMFSVINSKHGKSVIEQLDLTTGKWLFQRNDDIGIAGPLVIAGDKLIGMIYDRNAGRPTINYKNPQASMKYSGIAAFNLK